MNIGDKVYFAKMPQWVEELPEESRQIFQACLGKSFVISEIDQNGLFVLDVSQEIDDKFGGFMNDIRLEAEYLRESIEQSAD